MERGADSLKLNLLFAILPSAFQYVTSHYVTTQGVNHGQHQAGADQRFR